MGRNAAFFAVVVASCGRNMFALSENKTNVHFIGSGGDGNGGGSSIAANTSRSDDETMRHPTIHTSNLF